MQLRQRNFNRNTQMQYNTGEIHRSNSGRYKKAGLGLKLKMMISKITGAFNDDEFMEEGPRYSRNVLREPQYMRSSRGDMYSGSMEDNPTEELLLEFKREYKKLKRKADKKANSNRVTELTKKAIKTKAKQAAEGALKGTSKLLDKIQAKSEAYLEEATKAKHTPTDSGESITERKETTFQEEIAKAVNKASTKVKDVIENREVVSFSSEEDNEDNYDHKLQIDELPTQGLAVNTLYSIYIDRSVCLDLCEGSLICNPFTKEESKSFKYIKEGGSCFGETILVGLVKSKISDQNVVGWFYKGNKMGKGRAQVQIQADNQDTGFVECRSKKIIVKASKRYPVVLRFKINELSVAADYTKANLVKDQIQKLEERRLADHLGLSPEEIAERRRLDMMYRNQGMRYNTQMPYGNRNIYNRDPQVIMTQNGTRARMCGVDANGEPIYQDANGRTYYEDGSYCRGNLY